MIQRAGMILAVGVCAVLVGCASPSYRIERNPDAFAKATPDQQTKIQRGEIAMGFTSELVELAWGRPSRILSRVSESGKRVVWSYRSLESGRYGYGSCGYSSSRSYYHRHSPLRSSSYEYARVVFADGVVIEYQRIN